MHSLLDLRVFFLQRLRPSEWQRTLLLAALIGVLGALATVAFREGLFLIERLIYGRSDGLVRIAASLPWWERLLVPGVGGVAAGLVLAWARRTPTRGDPGDFLAALKTVTHEVLRGESPCFQLSRRRQVDNLVKQ